MPASGRLGIFYSILNQDGLLPHLGYKDLPPLSALNALPASDLMRDAAEQLKLSDRKWGDGLFADDSGKFIVTETHFIYLVNQTQHNRQNDLKIEGKTEIAKLHFDRFWVKVPHPAGLCFKRDERVSELARFSMDQVFFLTSENKKYSYNISDHTFIEVNDFLCGGFKGKNFYGHSDVGESGREADVLKLCENNQLKWKTRDKRWLDTIDESNWLDVPNPLNNEEIIIKLCSMSEKHYFYTSHNRVFTLSQSANSSTFVAQLELDNQIIDMGLTSDNVYLLCNNGLLENRNQHGFVPVQVDLHDGEQITSLSTSLYHAFFITNQNRIFCTGRNDLGQLGLGDEIHRTELTEVNLNLKSDQKILGVTCGTEFTILHTNQGNIISGHLFNSEKSRFDDRHQPTFPSNNPVPLSQLQISLYLLGFIASIASIVVPFIIGIIFNSIPLIFSTLIVSPIFIGIMFLLWHSMQFRNHFSLHPLVLDAINNEENCIDGKDDPIRIYPSFSSGPSW